MKILIVKPGGIGDTLLLFPTLVELKKRHPDAAIDVIGNKPVLTLFHDADYIRRAASIDDRDAANLVFTVDDHAVSILRSYQKLIFLIDDDGGILRQCVTAGIPDCIIASGTQHETRLPQWRYLLGVCGLDQTIPEAGYCRAFAGPREPSHRTGIVIHPGSGGTGKNWPTPGFVKIIRHCRSVSDEPIAIILGYAESHLHREFDVFRDVPGIAFFLDMSLASLLSLIRSARLYCGNDSGISHLAGLAGTPSVVLFGPTDPAIWRPIGDAVRVIRPSEGTGPMDAISTTSVLDAVASIMRGERQT